MKTALPHPHINQMLVREEGNVYDLFPHITALKKQKYIFKFDFGLKELPREPGILMIRGARQYGKSTWLENELYKTIKQFGPGSAFYLNGENAASDQALEQNIEALIPAFSKRAKVRRIFIDEITAISKWEMALKRLADKGVLKNILIITTGSSAIDLRRGAEKLPGRKGRLARSTYLFTPISYKEFHRVCGKILKKNTLIAYLLSGGSPIACSELAAQKTIPEFVIELVRDWIEGEITKQGRNRSALINTMNTLFRFGGTSVGQAKLAREAGLANNTVAANYIEALNDLGCVAPAYPWDMHKKLLILRKPCKYHFTNLLAATTYHPDRLRKPADFLALPEQTQGMWYEWLVAQELQRRTAIRGDAILMPLAFWQNKDHDIDFVDAGTRFIEVKRGARSSLEFSWFAKQFQNQELTVINSKKFETETMKGISLEAFLLDDD